MAFLLKNMRTTLIQELSVQETNGALEYAEREALKDFGWRKYYSNTEIENRANGLELVIFAHFNRSKEGYRGKHPLFDLFASHWLVANGDSYDADVIDILIKRYGPIEGDQMIATHMSYWE